MSNFLALTVITDQLTAFLRHWACELTIVIITPITTPRLQTLREVLEVRRGHDHNSEAFLECQLVRDLCARQQRETQRIPRQDQRTDSVLALWRVNHRLSPNPVKGKYYQMFNKQVYN